MPTVTLQAGSHSVTTPDTWTVTIHRFQPKTGKHRNQTFELAGTSDAPLKPTMTMAFGEANESSMYDLVARTHAVLRIEVLSDRNHIDIWTAPVVIRPYVEKLPRDYTEITKKLYGPISPAPDTSWMDDTDPYACNCGVGDEGNYIHGQLCISRNRPDQG